MVDLRANEVWRNISALNGVFQISDKGRVRRTNGKIVPVRKCDRGYLWFSYRKNGASNRYSVARAVLESFIGLPVGDSNQSDHINRIRDDNRLENLRWVTKAQNLANRQNAFGERHPNAKLTEANVYYILRSPLDSNDLALVFNVSSKTIRDVKNRKTWRHINI